MPELPEVETIRLGVKPVLQGRSFARIAVQRRDLRYPLPNDFVPRLQGQYVKAIDRRGKYLLVGLAEGTTLIIHFGMSGRLSLHRHWPKTLQRHDHIVMQMQGGKTLVFNDPRRFGFMALVEGKPAEDSAFLPALGPDPLSPVFTSTYLGQRLSKRRGALKPALLDQSLIAGIGNIYACESLYQAGISPLRRACDLKKHEVNSLTHALKRVLQLAIQSGGSSLRDHRRPDGNLGYFQHHFAVYGRESEICHRPGGGKIIRITQAGRATFYCPLCQK